MTLNWEITKILLENLENDGVYPGDSRMKSVWAYKNVCYPSEKLSFMVCTQRDNETYMLHSECVGFHVMLWESGRGLTPAGRRALTSEGESI